MRRRDRRARGGDPLARFVLAKDSRQQLDRYLNLGRVLAAASPARKRRTTIRSSSPADSGIGKPPARPGDVAAVSFDHRSGRRGHPSEESGSREEHPPGVDAEKWVVPQAREGVGPATHRE